MTTFDLDEAESVLAAMERWAYPDDTAQLRAAIAEVKRLRDRESTGVEAVSGLLAFIRAKYPDDFQPNGRGYVCPHHIKLAAWLKGAEDANHA